MFHKPPDISVEELRSKAWQLTPEPVGLNAAPQPVLPVLVFQSLCLSPSAFSPSACSSARHHVNFKSMLFYLHFLFSFSVPQFRFHNLFFLMSLPCQDLPQFRLSLSMSLSLGLSVPQSAPCLCLSYMAGSCLRAWRPLA